MGRQIVITIAAEIPEGATLGPDFGNQLLTPQVVQEYLTGAFVVSELMIPGVLIDGDSIAVMDA